MKPPRFEAGERVRMKPLPSCAPWEPNELGTVRHQEGYAVTIDMDDGNEVTCAVEYVEHHSYTPKRSADVPKEAPLSNHGKMPRK